MSVMALLAVVVAKEWRWVERMVPFSFRNGKKRTKFFYSYTKNICSISLITLLMLAACRCKIYITWWWSEAVPRVSRFCNYGYSWMPTSLPWNPRILWRIKYESWTTGSSPSGWEASSKWGHGGRKECKAWTLKALSVRGNFLSLVYHSANCGQGHHHLPETRGLCLSEEQTVTTVWISSQILTS